MGISNKKVPHPRHVLCDRVGTFDFAKGLGTKVKNCPKAPNIRYFAAVFTTAGSISSGTQ